jgi:hypothetical protein
LLLGKAHPVVARAVRISLGATISREERSSNPVGEWIELENS